MWEVPGFEPRKSVEDPKPVSPLARQYSISTPSIAPRAELAKHSVAVKLQSLKDQLKEGSSNEHGLYLRCFEELFDLSISDATSTSRYDFYFTALELYNEEVRDLLAEFRNSLPRVQMGPPDSVVEVVQEKVDNPLDFSRVLKAALQNHARDPSKANVSHLILTIHIRYTNWVTMENLYSKLSLVDLPGSECLLVEDASGDHVKDFLHVSKSLSA